MLLLLCERSAMLKKLFACYTLAFITSQAAFALYALCLVFSRLALAFLILARESSISRFV